jgi:hypothetical protein
LSSSILAIRPRISGDQYYAQEHPFSRQPLPGLSEDVIVEASLER